LILSIIIVNWDTKNLLKDCLQSIFKNPPEVEFEIFVVDNASSDGSVEMVQEDFPGVYLFCNKQNVGFARANNQAIRESKGEYVLLLNSDTEVSPGALDGMVEFLDSHPEVGAVGPQLVDLDGKVEESCGFFPTPKAILLTKLRRSKLLGSWFKNSRASILVPQRTQEVDWVTGACLMTRREAFEEIGLLDEEMFMYFEDDDWCYRIKKAGWRVYFTPEATVIHKRGVSLDQVPDRMIYEYRKSQLRLYKKHLGFSSQGILRLIALVHSTLMLCKYWMQSLIDRRKKQEFRQFLSSHWKIIKMCLGV